MKSNTTDPKKTERIEAIRRVMTETGFTKNWSELARTLNDVGVRPMSSPQWRDGTTVRNFCLSPQNFVLFADLLPPDAKPNVRQARAVSHTERGNQVQHSEGQSETTASAQDTVLHSETQPVDSRMQDSEAQCETPAPVVTIPENVLPDSQEAGLSDSAIHSGTPEGDLQHTEVQSLTPPVVTHEEHSVLQTGGKGSAQHSVTQRDTPSAGILYDYAIITGQHRITHRGDPLRSPNYRILQVHTAVLDELEQILEWWKHREGEGMPVITQQARPKFKREKTDTVTIRLSTDMIDAAKKFVRQHAWTGGKFNSFIEIILWRALGSKPKFVEPETE